MDNMKTNNIKKLIIIGSGPAGYTASIYAARANLKPILITGLQKGGQLTTTNNIENWPGRLQNTKGIELMNDMEKHALKLNTRIIQEEVLKIDFSKKILQIILEKKKYFSYAVIIATGSSPRYLGLKNEKEFLGRGISTCATCDGFFYKNKEVAIVGGGNTAIEEALYLSNIVSVIHLIHRNTSFKAEKILMNRLMQQVKKKKVILYTNYIVNKIIIKNQKIQSIQIISDYLSKKKTICISGLFIAIGSIPNTQIFAKHIKTKSGYITIQKKYNNITTQTNIPGVFAAGDVVDTIYKQAITAAASGCRAALDAEKYLTTLNI
ncbi:thioredoxin-disulfide reductase [Buchnera aphidicola]